MRHVPTAGLTPGDKALMHALFDSNYRQANHPYLDKSFGVLHHSAIAIEKATGVPAGFALGDMRIADLPRLPQQVVGLAGICCIDPEFRRRGLFGALEQLAIAGAGVAPTGSMLMAGRMAHPASMRTMNYSDGAIPQPGVPLTAWQREVGRAVADLYGTAEFDAETFVCRGTGAPIGYPVMEIEVAPEEWIVFEPVDRDRGDALLGLSWRPKAPEGWTA
jgi:hypothetical protein